MTRTASARLAGLTYLLYMALGIPAMVLIAGIRFTFFAMGSMIFSYLILRNRMVPIALAGFEVLALILLVLGVPRFLTRANESPGFEKNRHTLIELPAIELNQSLPL